MKTKTSMFHETWWSTEYNGHKIKVNNFWFGSSELYIDDKLQDKALGLFSVKLTGKIMDKNTEKDLKVSITSTFLTVECDIFVDNEAIYSSSKDK